MTTYSSGTVTIAKNALKVYGSNTNWLSSDIKATDLLVISGNVYEIAEVNSSTELTLTNPFTGNNLSSSVYVIVRVSPQVIAADLAALLYSFMKEHNELVKDVKGTIGVIKGSRLYIDTEGDLAQDDSEDQSHTGKDESDNAANDDEVSEMLDNILG